MWKNVGTRACVLKRSEGPMDQLFWVCSSLVRTLERDHKIPTTLHLIANLGRMPFLRHRVMPPRIAIQFLRGEANKSRFCKALSPIA